MNMFDYLAVYGFLIGSDSKIDDSKRARGALVGIAVGIFLYTLFSVYEIFYDKLTVFYNSMHTSRFNHFIYLLTGILYYTILYNILLYIYVVKKRLDKLIKKYVNISEKQKKIGTVVYITFVSLPTFAFIIIDTFILHPIK